MAKLCQVLAIEKGIKQKVNTEGAALHKLAQRAEIFSGLEKHYLPLDEEDRDTLPSETKKVQASVSLVIEQQKALLSELFDVEATKDSANCTAKSDVVVDGEVVIKEVPATFLLFMEKQLDDWHTIIKELPTLSAEEDWIEDKNSGLYKTTPVKTHRTKKVQKPIVLYDATDKHPAQTQLITEDIIAGYWEKTQYSGAIPAARKRVLMAQADKLRSAVKMAREQANSEPAPDKKFAEGIFNFLLK